MVDVARIEYGGPAPVDDAKLEPTCVIPGVSYYEGEALLFHPVRGCLLG